MTRCLVVMRVVLAAAVAPSFAGDAPLSEFEAEQIAILRSGKTQEVYRVLAAPDKVRFERKGKHSELITIQRRDLGVAWTLVPATRRYTEEKLAEDGFAAALRLSGPVVTNQVTGTETVDGTACTRERVVLPTVSLGRTGVTEAVVWTSPRLPYPVRIQRPDGTLTQLRNIVGGSQPEGLFEVPDDYVKTHGIMAALTAPPPSPTNAPPSDPKPRRPDAFNVKSYKWKFGVPL